MTSEQGVDRAVGQPGVHAHRVIFVDLARALAVLLMLNGHTISALLAPEYAAAPWYNAWQFQRGLTSSLFLLLSGFAFSIATNRHWAAHTYFSPAVARRLRRFTFFILLGYSLHFPVRPFFALLTVSDERWQSFLAVDVLQLIGVTFVFVQGLVLVCRSRAIFTGAAFGLAAILVLLSPMVWATDWSVRLPLWAAAYLTPVSGSLFPVFPYAASVFIGAGAGQIYARWGAAHLVAFANHVLLGGGVVLVMLAQIPGWMDVELSATGTSFAVQFVVRTGSSLVILGLVAHLSLWIRRLPRVFSAVAQESLTIYYVHLCLVYGSIWSSGLLQWTGATLSPVQALPIALALIAAMALLAWHWNRCKHSRPLAARWIRIGVAGLAAYRLL